MTLYNLHSDGTITKWDADGNIQAQYSVSEDGCTCPAGHRHTCRHRQMLSDLLPIADTHWFLDWDNGRQVVDFNGTPRQIYDFIAESGPALLAEEDCTGHVASANDPKVCGLCGVHIDSLRPASVDLPAEQDTLEGWGTITPEDIGKPVRINLPSGSWRRL